MQIMSCRLEYLQEAYAGLEQTGIPLVALRDGVLCHAGRSDDCGTYLIIPQIASWLRLSIPEAIDAFYYSVILGCFAIGLFGLFCVYKKMKQRLTGFIGLTVIAFYTAKAGDVYVFAPCLTMALIPWLLYGLKQQEKRNLSVWLLPMAGLFSGLSHIMRSQSGTAVLVFAMMLLMVRDKASIQRRLLVLLQTAFAALAPLLFAHYLTAKSDAYIQKHDPVHRPVSHLHAYWHSVYIGLGFVNNPYVPAYKDEVAVEKVKSINPEATYLSEEYLSILTTETFRIREFAFWINNFGAKMGVILLYFLIFANVGVLLRVLIMRSFEFDLAFGAALLMSSLPGMLVVPYKVYLLGFIALAVLYNVAIVNAWFDRSRMAVSPGSESL